MNEPEVKKRTRYEICRDTLDTVREEGITRSHLNILRREPPLDRANEVTSFLCCRRLLNEQRNGNDRFYRLTSRGGEFLQALETVNTYLDG